MTPPSAASARRSSPALLTLVVEDYFQVGAFRRCIPSAHWPRFPSRLATAVDATLELLAGHGQRATFFADRFSAAAQPAVLRAVVAAGHELACLGPLVEGDPAAHLRELIQARDALEQLSGGAVHGHRLGARWIGPHETELLRRIEAAGFRYDSSLRPIGRARQPAEATIHRRGELVEVPVSSVPLVGAAPWRLPVAGGNWFRQMPDALARHAAQRWSVAAGDAPLVAYFHTWELDPAQPRIDAVGPLQRLRHYHRLERMPQRLGRWLEQHRCMTVGEHLRDQGWLGAKRGPMAAAATSPAAVPAPLARAPAPLARAPARAAAPAGPRPALTLVVPCFNEAESLPYLMRTLEAFTRAQAHALELSYVLVDDGSRDTTWAGLQALAAALPRCTLRRHPANRGIGAALLTGFAACRSELVAVIDADCSFDPAQLPALLERLTDGVDVVCASPAHDAGTMKNVPRWRAGLSQGAAFLYRRVLNQQLTSYTSCFRLYRRDAVQGLVLSDGGFPGVTEILGRLDLAGRRFAEAPAVLEPRLLGRSKIRVLRTTADHLRLLVRLAACRWLGRPMPARVFAMT